MVSKKAHPPEVRPLQQPVNRAYISGMTQSIQTANPASDRWEIADQWRMAWKGIKWTVYGLLSFLALIIVGQVYLFAQMFSDIHPLLGGAFVLTATGLIFWLVGLPVFRFLKSPTIAQPPDVNLDAAIVPYPDLRRRHRYDLKYLKNIMANPALVTKHAEASKAYDDLVALKKVDTAEIPKKLAAFERERIAPLLTDLDKEIDDYIHKEALAVGSATAVSMNGSIDAFVVLWRNVNMVSRISRLYYGRPSLRLSLTILRDVMVAVLLSRALDDVTDAAGEALSGVVSKLGGMVVGPMMDGSVNALMTTKIGYLTKKRCRSFDVWSKSSSRRATVEVFDQVKRESANLISELVKISGGVVGAAGNIVGAAAQAAGSAAGAAADAAGGVVEAAGGAAGKVLSAPKSAWSVVQDRFVKKPVKDGS